MSEPESIPVSDPLSDPVSAPQPKKKKKKKKKKKAPSEKKKKKKAKSVDHGDVHISNASRPPTNPAQSCSTTLTAVNATTETPWTEVDQDDDEENNKGEQEVVYSPSNQVTTREVPVASTPHFGVAVADPILPQTHGSPTPHHDKEYGCKGCCSCPHGGKAGAVLISMVWLSYFFSSQGAGQCQYLTVRRHFDTGFGTTLKNLDYGLLRRDVVDLDPYDNVDGGCILWGEEEDYFGTIPLVWKQVRTLILSGALYLFSYVVFLSTTSCVHYPPRVLRNAVWAGFLLPLLFGCTFVVFASDVCLAEGETDCAIGSGAIFMGVAILSWLLTLWILERLSHGVGLGLPQPNHPTQRNMWMPSRLFYIVVIVVLVFIFFVNILVISQRQLSDEAVNPFLPGYDPDGATPTSAPWTPPSPTQSPVSSPVQNPTQTPDTPQNPPTSPPTSKCVNSMGEEDAPLTLDMENLDQYYWREFEVSTSQLGFNFSVQAGNDYALSRDGKRIVLELKHQSSGRLYPFLVVFETPGRGCQQNWKRLGGDIKATEGSSSSSSEYQSIEMSGSGDRFIVSESRYDYGYGLVEVWDWDGVEWIMSGSFRGLELETLPESPSSSYRQGLGYDVAISSDGNRIAMVPTPGQYGTPEGFARVMEWNSQGLVWEPLGNDIQMSSLVVLNGEVSPGSELQYSHVILSPDGNRVLVVANLPLAYYGIMFEYQGDGQWRHVEDFETLELAISDAANFNAQFSDNERLAVGWKDISTPQWSASAMVYSQDGQWQSLGTKLSDIDYHWRPEIAINMDGSRVAVRELADDRVGLKSLVYDTSAEEWVDIGTSISYLSNGQSLESFRWSKWGDMAITYGTYMSSSPKMVVWVLQA